MNPSGELTIAAVAGSPTAKQMEQAHAWQATLDEDAVTQVLQVYLPTDAQSSSLADVAATTGINISRLRLFWQALGFARVEDDATQLTADDVDLITTLASFFVDRTREQGVGLQMARVLGSNLDRIASAQVDSLVSRVLLNGPAVGAHCAKLMERFDVRAAEPSAYLCEFL